MEENAAVDSPMFNGDGMEDQQTPVEEESMTTTVLKDDSRINWPGNDGDADVKQSEEPPAASAEDKPPVAGDMDEQQDTEAGRYSITDIEDDPNHNTDDAPAPPPPIMDESPPQSPDAAFPDDVPEPANDASPADQTFGIADIPEPNVEDYDDDDDPELQALAQQEKSDSNTLGLPDVQIIVTPGTPVPDSSPTDFQEEDESSHPEEQSTDAPVAFVDGPSEDVIVPEESEQVETSPEETRESPVEISPEETREPERDDIGAYSPPPMQDEESKQEELVNPVEDHFPPEPEPQSESPLVELESQDPTGEPAEVENLSDSGEKIPEDLDQGPSDILDMPPPDLPPPEEPSESNKNGEETDSGTLSEGGSTPRQEPEGVVSGFLPPPEHENTPQEVEIQPETAHEDYAVYTEDQAGDGED